MVTLQAKQQPPSQQQQQHLHHQQASPQLEHRYERAAEEETWDGLEQQLTCDNHNGNKQNGRREVDSREDWPISNDLKSNNGGENRERRGAEVANIGEDTSSRSGKDTGSCGEGSKQNGRGGYDSRDNWAFSNDLKSNNRDGNRGRRVAEVANDEETTSSRSGSYRQGKGSNNNRNKQNGPSDYDSRDNWAFSNDLKSSNRDENREKRVAEVANDEETTSSRSGSYREGKGNNNNRNKQNGPSGYDSRDHFAFSNDLKSNNRDENREKRVAEVANDQETTSSRSGSYREEKGSNTNGNKQNSLSGYYSRDNWAFSNDLKSNDIDENREKRVAEVANDQETTSSRSGSYREEKGSNSNGNKQNSPSGYNSRDNWAFSNDLKSNNIDENREKRVAEVANDEETTSSRSGSYREEKGSNSNGNKQNSPSGYYSRDNWAFSNDLKSNNRDENREKRVAEVANDEETTSSRSGSHREGKGSNNNGNKQNGRSDYDSRDNWAFSNDLKSNNRDENREKRVAEVANDEETTSSRSGSYRDGKGSNNNRNKQNGPSDYDSRDNWAFSNDLKSNNIDENRERRVAEVASFREETTSSRSGKGGSTQCSDIEDDEDVEIEEELEEEENYQVDEVDSEDEEDYYEDDKDVGNQVAKSDRWIKKKVVTTRVQRQTCFGEGYGQSEVIPQMDETTFGEVAITNSKHVHVGNTNFYKGPVTIKQFVYTNAHPVDDKEDEIEGSSSARISDVNPNNVTNVKGDPNGPIFPSYHDYDTVTKWLWTWRCAAILCVVALILVTLIAVISVLLTKSDVPSRLPNVLPPSPDGNNGTELPSSVRLIEREMWNAEPPKKVLDKLEVSPTPYVIISHTATTPCTIQSECVLRVRLIQTFHKESFKWDDIGYNFLVGGDGNAYVGRSWDLAGAHAFGYNYKSIGISFIGTFNDVAPSALQLNAAKNLIKSGVNRTKIAANYKLLGHRQVSKTLSPGDQLYNILQTWDHWSPYPKPEDVSGANALKTHPAALLLLLITTLPHLLIILRRSSRFFLPFARAFCNIVYYHFTIIYVQ